MIAWIYLKSLVIHFHVILISSKLYNKSSETAHFGDEIQRRFYAFYGGLKVATYTIQNILNTPNSVLSRKLSIIQQKESE